MIDTSSNRPEQRHQYMLVQVDGSLATYRDTFQVMRQKFDREEGETSMEEIPNCHPMMAYHYVPFYNPEQQRMNKVANGIFWELSKPDPHVPEPEPFVPHDPHDPHGRIIEMRGPVVFCVRFDSLNASHVDAIRAAHERTLDRLQSKGWI